VELCRLKKECARVGTGRNQAVVDSKECKRCPSPAKRGQIVHCKDSSYAWSGRLPFPFSSEKAILPFSSEATPGRK